MILRLGIKHFGSAAYYVCSNACIRDLGHVEKKLELPEA